MHPFDCTTVDDSTMATRVATQRTQSLMLLRRWCLLFDCILLLGAQYAVGVVESFSQGEPRPVTPLGSAASSLFAVLLKPTRQVTISVEEEQQLLHALEVAGYGHVSSCTTEEYSSARANQYCYELSKATGMLKLVATPALAATTSSSDAFDAPRWVPVVRGEENVLVANGWSFLDPDESEPMSAFDIDAANIEGLYRPKWGDDDLKSTCTPDDQELTMSSLGFDIAPMGKDDILAEASLLTQNEHSRGVLLDGKTDPPGAKITCNGFDFRGSAGQLNIASGLFVTAIGGLPLFASTDLSPTTGSSGWLSFSRPLAASHIHLIDPDKDSVDQRIEVVCAKSRTHLGHYFGPGEGYCINASALRFIPAEQSSEFATNVLPKGSVPISWRPLDSQRELSPSENLLRTIVEGHVNFDEVALGCGCFWHVEHALRRLPGIYTTRACYAGGNKDSPTYKDVCGGKSGHAEVVWIRYDPNVCPSNVLFDCFLAMHDPTKVRALGKHAHHTGQYRSCIFTTTPGTERIARDCLERCRLQLNKELSTDVRLMESNMGKLGERWCWEAEERHQRHDEIVKGRESGMNNDPPSTLSATQWLTLYGRRAPTILRSSETVPIGMESHPEDDGMARMMI